MKKYGIKEKATGKILEVDANSDIFERNEIVYYSLGEYSINDTFWLVDTKKDVEKAIHSKAVPYYNANYSTPQHNYSPDELEVVEVDILVDKELSQLEYVENLKSLKKELIKNMEDVFDLLMKENNEELSQQYYNDGKDKIKIAYMGKEFVINMGATLHSALIQALEEEIKDIE